MENVTEIGVEKQLSIWFDNFIGELRADELSIEAGIASQEKQDMYNLFSKGSTKQIAEMGLQMNSAFLITELVKDYVLAIKEYKIKPRKLAFDWSLNKVRVWAEINDEDETTENALILAEAKSNAKNQKSGVYLSSTIVEESDMLDIPSHYVSMQLPKA